MARPSPGHGGHNHKCGDIDAECDQYEDYQRDDGDQRKPPNTA